MEDSRNEDFLSEEADEYFPDNKEDEFLCDLIEIRNMLRGNGWKEVESFMNKRIDEVRDRLMSPSLDHTTTTLLRGMALNCAQILAYPKYIEQTLLEEIQHASETSE